MDNQEISARIIDIISGRLFYEDITIKQPSIILKQKSYLHIEKIAADIKYDGFKTREEMKQLLIKKDLLPANVDILLKELEITIENKKLDAYKSRYNIPNLNLLKKTINTLQYNINDLYNQIYAYDFSTIEGYLDYCRQLFIISNVCYKNGRKLEVDGILVEKIYRFLIEKKLSQDTIRQISKAGEWKSIWNTSRGKPFKGPPTCFTEDQKSLILYTKMYENAYKHPECPDDGVLQDDILFDGWQIFMRKKAENEKSQQKIQDQYGNADAISLPAKELAKANGISVKEQVEQINKMNSPTNSQIKKQREQAIAQKGKLAYTELPDVKFEMQLEANKKR